MVRGLGIDIVEIDRIEAVLEKWGRRFTERVFSEQEIEICQRKGSLVQSLAVRFAAKEALSKALGTGWSGGFQWKDVELLSEDTGQPEIRLHGRVKQMVGEGKVLVSLSHTRENAMAVVLIT